MTLRRCIADGNWIKAPKLRTVGGVKVLRWSDRDVERVHNSNLSRKIWRTRGRRLAKLASQPSVSVLMQCT